MKDFIHFWLNAINCTKENNQNVTYSSKSGNCLYSRPNANNEDRNIIATRTKAFGVDISSALDVTPAVEPEIFTTYIVSQFIYITIKKCQWK